MASKNKRLEKFRRNYKKATPRKTSIWVPPDRSTFICKVTKCILGQIEAIQGKPMAVEVVYTVATGKYKGKALRETIFLENKNPQAEEVSYSKLRTMFERLDIDSDDLEVCCQDAIGKVAEVYVQHWSSRSDRYNTYVNRLIITGLSDDDEEEQEDEEKVRISIDKRKKGAKKSKASKSKSKAKADDEDDDDDDDDDLDDLDDLDDFDDTFDDDDEGDDDDD